jgi:hypothetical protein
MVVGTACAIGAAQDQSTQQQPSQQQPSQQTPAQDQTNSPPSSSSQSQQRQDQGQPSQQQGQAQAPAQQQDQTQSVPQQPAQPPENPSPQNQPTDNQPPAGGEEKKDNPVEAAAQATRDAAVQAAQATLVKVRDWETEWFVGAYVGRNRPLVPLSAEGRKDLYLHQTYQTPGAYLDRAFDALIDQARGSPYQWGGGIGGYSERFASREGQFFASNSLAALANAKLRYEPRYDQCKCTGFWRRTRHAFARNFLTYNETETEIRPQLGLYAGAFGGGLISTAWKPKPRNAFAEGGRGMAGQVAWGTLLNLFTEFAVDINRKLGVTK